MSIDIVLLVIGVIAGLFLAWPRRERMGRQSQSSDGDQMKKAARDHTNKWPE